MRRTTNDTSKDNAIWMEEQLRENGVTLEEHRAALFSLFMYLDLFEEDVDKSYHPEKLCGIWREYEKAQTVTVQKLLEWLVDETIYTMPRPVGDESRHNVYQIWQEALRYDTKLAEYEVRFASRLMKCTAIGAHWNIGTNGMTFVSPDRTQAYIAYRGTSLGEWGDDGNRLSCKHLGEMTPQMRQALEYADIAIGQMIQAGIAKIYVTGHSQGGNDAQLAALLSAHTDQIQACYSFDGEGHSPELLRQIQARLGQAEYARRRHRMYSVCGEYDFVHRLGETLILESHTKYVRCHMHFWEIGKCHEMVSMFCDEGYHYHGILNTTVDVKPTWVVELTAKVWEELYEMPNSLRKSCQNALMHILEIVFSKGKYMRGLNGERASLKDYYLFWQYGLEMFLDSATKTVWKVLKDKILEACVGELLEKATQAGIVPERIANEVNEEIEAFAQWCLDTYEQISDLSQTKDYLTYSAIKIPLARLRNEDVQWEESYLYKAGERCMDYLAKYFTELQDELAQLISYGEQGWRLVQEIAMALGKQVLQMERQRITA